MTDSEPQLEELVSDYTSGDDARALYVYNAPISGEHVDELLRVIEPNLDVEASLFLCTNGGDPHAAYRLARLLRGCHKSLRLLLAGPCKSAGTLVAIGSDSIAFAPFGELGPLDVQMAMPEELILRSSGLDILQALASVVDAASDAFANNLLALTRAGLSTRIAARIATDLTTGLFKEITSQIEPIRLGEAVRANQIAMRYGEQLRTANLRDGALDELVSGYPDHGFVIDYEEARALFVTVDYLNSLESRIAAKLGEEIRYPSRDRHLIVNAARAYAGTRGEEPNAGNPTEAVSDPVREEAGRGSTGSRTAREGDAETNGARTTTIGADGRGEATSTGDGVEGR